MVPVDRDTGAGAGAGVGRPRGGVRDGVPAPNVPPSPSRPDSPAPPLVLDHLLRLSGPHGVFEHADHARPRLGHGYCVDDNARVLVVLERLGWPPATADLSEHSLSTVLDGLGENGWRNRLSADGTWLDQLGSEDCHGRALWGLGCRLRRRSAEEALVEKLAVGLRRELVAPRAIAYGILGAVEVVDHPVLGGAAEGFVERGVARLPPAGSGAWPWPEDRLTYANARIPEALIAAGSALGEGGLIAGGVALLEWLAAVETEGDRFSFTPVGGRSRSGREGRFDQQPIEAWAMLDACRRAGRVTGDLRWDGRARIAREWFFGRNDNGVWMYDTETGGGCDGLTAGGRNENRGAESTLAALAAVADTRLDP